MDRNREGRRATNMAAPPNGLSSSRRRHRSSGLRDSPDEDGGVEVQDAVRLRDRGGVGKKERGDRDRDRDRERERERSSRSKRRRENRMMIHHVNTGSNRDDTSDESVNEDEDDDDTGNGGGLRSLHPPPASTSAAASGLTSNHHSHNSHSSQQQQQQIHHRKSFPPSASKVFRVAPAAPPPPAWKAAADEMIGVSVPRKARSASTKRSHEWISGVVGTGADQIHRQSSTSPVRLAAPPSPSSSNVSLRKKMKANGGGSKPKPPKSSSKSSSSNPEELEIEIAEVLYGLMTQSQAPSKKENDSSVKIDSNKSSSRVSSPISNSTTAALPQNSTSLSTVAPKRKKPRQVSENPFNARNSPMTKTDIDQHHHQSPKTDISSPYLENNSTASAAAENGGFTGHKASSSPSSEPPMAPEDERKCGVGAVLTKEEVEKESHIVKLNDGNCKTEAVITTSTVTNPKVANLETQSQKDEKFEIDLMAPPPQQRTPHGVDGEVDFSAHKQMTAQETREDEKLKKSDTDGLKAGTIQETVEPSKKSVNEEINIQLNIDLEKPNKGNRSLHQALKHQQVSAKSETHTEKTAQPSSMPMPMSMANWPPMGYVAPLQGVISMDGNTMAPTPIQPLFTHPRPKRCATHCYIARNIHCLQQFMKNSFWPAASGSAAPMFGAKPCNLNAMPSTGLHANIQQSMQSMHDKGQAVGIFPGHSTGKDTKSSQPATITDPAQRKQQVLLQQAMPPVPPNNILHGPAFIFPFNQQQAVAASASVRPGSSKLTTGPAAGGLVAASGAASSATVSSSTTAAAPALSFNYPNANETQYLAILQNNPYSFPMPAVAAPPNYRSNPHAQAMPLFNGSFYSSQMIHPSQIPQPPQQATPPTQAQNHHPSQSQQAHQNSSGSTSSSQKHLQAQQRQQGSGATAVNGSGSGNGGNLHNSFHVSHKNRSQQSSQQQNQHMNPALQVRHLENEVTGGDSPSTADSRGSRAANSMSVYGHNFAMPVHSKVFAQMDHPNGALAKASGSAATAGANSNDKKQQQQQQGLKRGGVESSLSPQTFAMSFAPMNGATGGAMAQNHAIFQSLPESVRQSYQMMAAPATAAAAHHSQQKDFRISEESARTSHDSSNADEDRKARSGLTAKSGQSIAFSRPDLATDVSGSNNRSSRSPMSTSTGTGAPSSHLFHAQYQQQQQVLQLQKQQQQNQSMNNARTKNPPSSNGSAYPEHLITSSSSMASKFPNSMPSFPLQTNTTSGSPVQSPQWRNSVRGPPTSQVPSSLASAATTSSLKNLHQPQQQSSRSHPQSHTQISFGATASPKLQPTTSVQQQQQQNQNPSSNSGNRCPSPPMLVGSPTTTTSTSVRTGQASSLSSSQHAKNSPVGTQRSSPSILGNPNNSNSNKSQHQQQKQQTLHQQKVNSMMMYPNPYIQVQQAQAQAQQHAASSMAATGYSLYRMQQQQQQQQSSQQPSSSSSTAMLSLCPPVTHANTTTSDPAKAIAAATNMMYNPQCVAAAAAAAPSSMPAGFPQFVHNAPAAAVATAVQAKPTEQKQPAGNDKLHMWQPEK